MQDINLLYMAYLFGAFTVAVAVTLLIDQLDHITKTNEDS